MPAIPRKLCLLAMILMLAGCGGGGSSQVITPTITTANVSGFPASAAPEAIHPHCLAVAPLVL